MNLSIRSSTTIRVNFLLVGALAVSLVLCGQGMSAAGQGRSAVVAQSGGVITNGTDFAWTMTMENSSQLTNMAQNITPRITTKHASFGQRFGLQGSDTLNLIAESVQPRIVVVYADYASTHAMITGDLNGDGKVNLPDLVMLALAYGSKPGDLKWNPMADINGDGVVGLSDLTLLAIHYGH